MKITQVMLQYDTLHTVTWLEYNSKVKLGAKVIDKDYPNETWEIIEIYNTIDSDSSNIYWKIK